MTTPSTKEKTSVEQPPPAPPLPPAVKFDGAYRDPSATDCEFSDEVDTTTNVDHTGVGVGVFSEILQNIAADAVQGQSTLPDDPTVAALATANSEAPDDEDEDTVSKVGSVDSSSTISLQTVAESSPGPVWTPDRLRYEARNLRMHRMWEWLLVRYKLQRAKADVATLTRDLTMYRPDALKFLIEKLGEKGGNWPLAPLEPYMSEQDWADIGGCIGSIQLYVREPKKEKDKSLTNRPLSVTEFHQCIVNALERERHLSSDEARAVISQWMQHYRENTPAFKTGRYGRKIPTKESRREPFYVVTRHFTERPSPGSKRSHTKMESDEGSEVAPPSVASSPKRPRIAAGATVAPSPPRTPPPTTATIAMTKKDESPSKLSLSPLSIRSPSSPAVSAVSVAVSPTMARRHAEAAKAAMTLMSTRTVVHTGSIRSLLVSPSTHSSSSSLVPSASSTRVASVSSTPAVASAVSTRATTRASSPSLQPAATQSIVVNSSGARLSPSRPLSVRSLLSTVSSVSPSPRPILPPPPTSSIRRTA